MRFFFAAAALSLGMASIGAAPDSQAGSSRLLNCTARVIYSEELPFAPAGTWLVNVTLVITPPDGNAYVIALHEWMPWQGAPPRRGQAFRLRCDPANPDRLQLAPHRGV